MDNRTRTILCGVDGSDHSVRAATVSHALATAVGSDIVLAHVSQGVVRHLPLAPAATQVELEGALKVIADTAARAGLRGVRTRCVEAPSPTTGLVATARVELPHLIVVGASGHSTFREALLGSVAGELPLKAPCPVVLTPPDAVVPGSRLGRHRSVVCGVPDSREAPDLVRIAGELAGSLGARLILVNAQLPQAPAAGRAILTHHSEAIDHDVLTHQERRRSADLLQRALAWSSREEVETATEIGEPAERLEAVADREDADLIVVGSRGRGPLRAAVLGSTSRTLGASASRPVAIVGPSARG